MDLNQITIDVRDLDESIAFYQKLGLKLIVHSAASQYARFELSTGSTTLSLHHNPDAVVNGTVLYFEVDALDRRYEELVAAGVAFETIPTQESWRWQEARFADPTGNKLCLFHAGPDRRFPPWRIEANSVD